MVDTKIKMEPTDIEDYHETNINVKIKKEQELIIESDSQWLPVKLEDEQNEYYQDFVEDCAPPAYDHFTIKYIDEKEDYSNDDDEDDSDDDGDDDDSDYEMESEGGDKTMVDDSDGDDNMDTEYNLELENYAINFAEDSEKQEKFVDKKESLESKALYKYTLNKWLFRNYVMRECPTCNDQLAYYSAYRRHIEINHQDAIKESESNYYFTGNSGLCKECNKKFVSGFAMYVHSIKHTEDAENIDINICKICNYKSSKNVPIHTHIIKEHPEAVEKFKAIRKVNKTFKCTICRNTYNKYNELWYHFMDTHTQEYKAKFIFNCHICQHDQFCDEELYLQHLMENHKLNSWKVLNYRKLFDDKEYFACITCHRIFIKNDTRTLLSHYLEHQNSCYWTCKFCSTENIVRKSNYSHLCIKMLKYYEKRYKDVNVDKAPKMRANSKNYNDIKVDKAPEMQANVRKKLQNLQEFEEYIVHVCPFCKTEFSKLIKWQQHLRNFHEIDTLKGLEMKVIPANSNKLCCVICHTVVANSPVQLHAHRFQHLPYMPYKCLHCSVSLSTFKMAVNHVLKQCKDEEDRDYIKNVLVAKIIEPSNKVRAKVQMRCPFCNYKKFTFVKKALKHYEDEHNNFEELFSKHPNDNSVTCKVCGKQYAQYDKNVCFQHLHYHFEEKTFKCPLCPLSYAGFQNCLRHLRLNHYAKTLNQRESKEKSNIPETSSFLNNEEKVPNTAIMTKLAKPTIKTYVLNEFAEFISYACPECNEGMAKQQDWQRHITTQHNFFHESNLSIKEADGSLKCPTCKLNLPGSIAQRQKHRLTHMPFRSFICNLCYVRCNSLGVLYGHFRRVHFAQGTFECPICPEVLQTSYQRTKHIKEIHPRNEWPSRMCLICYKMLSTKSTVNSHMIIHDGDRLKYTCEVCGSKLTGLKDFKMHTARHESRGEIKDQKKAMNDDIPLQSESKITQTIENVDVKRSKDLNMDVHESKKEILNKTKSLTNSSATKKKKTDTNSSATKKKKTDTNSSASKKKKTDTK